MFPWGSTVVDGGGPTVVEDGAAVDVGTLDVGVLDVGVLDVGVLDVGVLAVGGEDGDDSPSSPDVGEPGTSPVEDESVVPEPGETGPESVGSADPSAIEGVDEEDVGSVAVPGPSASESTDRGTVPTTLATPVSLIGGPISADGAEGARPSPTTSAAAANERTITAGFTNPAAIATGPGPLAAHAAATPLDATALPWATGVVRRRSMSTPPTCSKPATVVFRAAASRIAAEVAKGVVMLPVRCVGVLRFPGGRRCVPARPTGR